MSEDKRTIADVRTQLNRVSALSTHLRVKGRHTWADEMDDIEVALRASIQTLLAEHAAELELMKEQQAEVKP